MGEDYDTATIALAQQAAYEYAYSNFNPPGVDEGVTHGRHNLEGPT